MGIKSTKALVLYGDGINCERETAAACREVGFEVELSHINDLIAARGAPIAQARLVILPGGFSFGDELGSGQVLALKLRHGAGSALDDFLSRGGAVFGICNGFQVLVRLGVFGPGVSLTHNSGGHFLNRWVELEVTGRSLFTDGFATGQILGLPMRHGEGRIVFSDPGTRSKLAGSGGFVLRYTEDVNGSDDRLAGLSSYDGRVLGLMPHPEAFWSPELSPVPGRRWPLGLEFFKNAYRFLNS